MSSLSHYFSTNWPTVSQLLPCSSVDTEEVEALDNVELEHSLIVRSDLEFLYDWVFISTSTRLFRYLCSLLRLSLIIHCFFSFSSNACSAKKSQHLEPQASPGTQDTV